MSYLCHLQAFKMTDPSVAKDFRTLMFLKLTALDSYWETGERWWEKFPAHSQMNIENDFLDPHGELNR